MEVISMFTEETLYSALSTFLSCKYIKSILKFNFALNIFYHNKTTQFRGRLFL